MWLTNNNLRKTDIWIKFLLVAVFLLGIIDSTAGTVFFLNNFKDKILKIIGLCTSCAS